MIERAVVPVLIALSALVACPARAAAQQKEAAPRDVPAERADVAITGSVTASELRFDVVPTPTVEFFGTPERLTLWDAERLNLPRPVEPGVTYRDVGVRLKIVSVFADIDRIVAEALGEVPVSDAAQPETAPPPLATPEPTPPAREPSTPAAEPK